MGQIDSGQDTLEQRLARASGGERALFAGGALEIDPTTRDEFVDELAQRVKDGKEWKLLNAQDPDAADEALARRRKQGEAMFDWLEQNSGVVPAHWRSADRAMEDLRGTKGCWPRLSPELLDAAINHPRARVAAVAAIHHSPTAAQMERVEERLNEMGAGKKLRRNVARAAKFRDETQ